MPLNQNERLQNQVWVEFISIWFPRFRNSMHSITIKILSYLSRRLATRWVRFAWIDYTYFIGIYRWKVNSRGHIWFRLLIIRLSTLEENLHESPYSLHRGPWSRFMVFNSWISFFIIKWSVIRLFHVQPLICPFAHQQRIFYKNKCQSFAKWSR